MLYEYDKPIFSYQLIFRLGFGKILNFIIVNLSNFRYKMYLVTDDEYMNTRKLQKYNLWKMFFIAFALLFVMAKMLNAGTSATSSPRPPPLPSPLGFASTPAASPPPWRATGRIYSQREPLWFSRSVLFFHLLNHLNFCNIHRYCKNMHRLSECPGQRKTRCRRSWFY